MRDNFSLLRTSLKLRYLPSRYFHQNCLETTFFTCQWMMILCFHSLRSGSYWWSFGEATSLNWRIWQYLLVRFLGRSLQRRHGQREMCRIGKTVCHPCNHERWRKWRMCEVRGHWGQIYRTIWRNFLYLHFSGLLLSPRTELRDVYSLTTNCQNSVNFAICLLLSKYVYLF